MVDPTEMRFVASIYDSISDWEPNSLLHAFQHPKPLKSGYVIVWATRPHILELIQAQSFRCKAIIEDLLPAFPHKMPQFPHCP